MGTVCVAGDSLEHTHWPTECLCNGVCARARATHHRGWVVVATWTGKSLVWWDGDNAERARSFEGAGQNCAGIVASSLSLVIPEGGPLILVMTRG